MCEYGLFSSLHFDSTEGSGALLHYQSGEILQQNRAVSHELISEYMIANQTWTAAYPNKPFIFTDSSYSELKNDLTWPECTDFAYFQAWRASKHFKYSSFYTYTQD